MSGIIINPPRKPYAILGWLLGFLLAARMALLILAPHQDPSEARYAELSRKMVETGDWIVPQHFYGVPFWAKPPLSMWASAAGMKLFGVNEFGSRILIFLTSIVTLWLIARFAHREISRVVSVPAAAFLMGMPIFFYCSAAVMTDMVLTLGTTLSLLSFWFAVNRRGKWAGYGFFLGLAIGMLAKGPLSLVLCGVPGVVWIAATGKWRSLGNLPWLGGTLLFLAITVPWYAAAEFKSPGFLDYFLIGEHWKRFVVEGWEGDLYGSAHAEIPGTIWLFGLLALLPWTVALLAVGLREWRGASRLLKEENHLLLYLLLWAFWPLVFFTPARNIISTYVLPALPAFALLLAVAVERSAAKSRFHPGHPMWGGITAVMVTLTVLVTLAFPQFSPKHSEKELVGEFRRSARNGEPLVYYGKRKYSAEFYNGGKVLTVASPEALAVSLDEPTSLYVAIRPKDFSELPTEIQSRLKLTRGWQKHHNLYREIPQGHGT